jgi:hypothetical protein
MKSLRLFPVIFALVVSGTASAEDTCLASPTNDTNGRGGKTTVSSRFGVWRDGHTHSGLDFQTMPKPAGRHPLTAASDGVIVLANVASGAGNALYIKRPNGDVIAYWHMSSYSPKITARQPGWDQVKAGEFLGYAGGTGTFKSGAVKEEAYPVHLHFNYGVPDGTGLRNRGLGRKSDGTIIKERAAQVVGKGDKDKKPLYSGTYHTDPAPYFCDDYEINDGHTELIASFGKTIKQQHQAVYGNVTPGGKPPELTAVAADTAAKGEAQAEAAAKGDVAALSEGYGDGLSYGYVPEASFGSFLNWSPLAMMLTEARRRFNSWMWQTMINKASTRALYIDYLKAIAVENYMEEVAQRKREKIQMLIALYALQKSAHRGNGPTDPKAQEALQQQLRRLTGG